MNGNGQSGEASPDWYCCWQSELALISSKSRKVCIKINDKWRGYIVAKGRELINDLSNEGNSILHWCLERGSKQKNDIVS